MDIDTTGSALLRRWQEAFQATLSDSGLVANCATMAQHAPLDHEQLLWWRQPVGTRPEGHIWIGAESSTWQRLGLLLLRSAGIGPGGAEDLQVAYLDVVINSLTSLVEGLADSLGRNLPCPAGEQSAPPRTGELEWISVGVGYDEPLEICFCASEGLKDLKPADAAPYAEEAPPRGGTLEEEFDLPQHAYRTLGFLLDVELPLTVTFGRSRMKLQDALRLTTGSIVELDRVVSDPVEVLVNNQVVARGVVVSVNGNYGVRIEQVMSVKERLRQSQKYLEPSQRGGRTGSSRAENEGRRPVMRTGPPPAYN